MFIEEALAWRRSIRIYKDEPITMEHLPKYIKKLIMLHSVSSLRFSII
ncbi:MAG: hypothetical protein QW476_02750 [Candidatus Bathyarchaeia archaeon]|nr:hypothetical protein [Candidatus Bathyarchaeota archaeon]